MLKQVNEQDIVPAHLLMQPGEVVLFDTNPFPGAVSLAMFHEGESGANSWLPHILSAMEFRLTLADKDDYDRQLVRVWVRRADYQAYQLRSQLGSCNQYLSDYYRYGLPAMLAVGFGIAALIRISRWLNQVTTPEPDSSSFEQFLVNWLVPGLVVVLTLGIAFGCWLPGWWRKRGLLSEITRLEAKVG